jgi:hypothetical protein
VLYSPSTSHTTIHLCIRTIRPPGHEEDGKREGEQTATVYFPDRTTLKLLGTILLASYTITNDEKER